MLRSLAALFMLVGPALSASFADLELCARQHGYPSIEACTRILDDPELSISAKHRIYVSRAITFLIMTDLYSARLDVDTAMMFGKSVQAFTTRGIIFVAEGKYAMAIEEFDRSLEIEPGHPDVIAKKRDAVRRLARQQNTPQ